MKEKLKYIFVGLLCCAFICTVITIMLLDTDTDDVPDPSQDPGETDHVDLGPGKFPGEKYATYYHVPNDVNFPKDVYDPLNNADIDSDKSVYEFSFNNEVYTGDVSRGMGLDVTAPYTYLGVSEPIVIGEERFNGVEIWLHSGEIKALEYVGKHDIGGPLSEDEIKQIVNKKAAEYIDINKYEIVFKFNKYSGTATYNQKFGNLYLAEPFTIRFGPDGYIYYIDFNKTGMYDELIYDTSLVRESIIEKFESINKKNLYTLKNIEFKNVDICKYNVAVVVSTVTMEDASGSEYSIRFYTKISD